MRCICVGQFYPWKGQRELLDLWSKARPRHGVRAELVFVGGGELAEEVAGVARERGLATTVEFLGEREDAVALIEEADLLILPSVESEAFGLVLLEAMRGSVPVFASKIGGIPEVLGLDGGVLFEHGLADEATDLLARLISDREYRTHVGRLGRARFQRNFLLPQMLSEYDKIFQDA